jgi:hypothetical protein
MVLKTMSIRVTQFRGITYQPPQFHEPFFCNAVPQIVHIDTPCGFSNVQTGHCFSKAAGFTVPHVPHAPADPGLWDVQISHNQGEGELMLAALTAGLLAECVMKRPQDNTTWPQKNGGERYCFLGYPYCFLGFPQPSF